MERNAGDHRVRATTKPGPQYQSALVVQNLLPPMIQGELGHHNGHEVIIAVAAELIDVAHDRPRKFPVWRVERVQLDRDLAAHAFEGLFASVDGGITWFESDTRLSITPLRVRPWGETA